MEIRKEKKSKILNLVKKTNCPNCKKTAKEPFVPFCSKKCASIDLMKWLNDDHQANIKN